MSLTNPEALGKICKYYGERLAAHGNHKQARSETSENFGISVESVDRYLSYQRSQESSIKSEGDISEELLLLVKKRKMTLIEIADHFSLAPKEINAAIEKLRSKHRLIVVNSIGEISCDNEIPPNNTPATIDLTKHREVEIPIGFVTDTHLCSKYERLDVLNALYDRFESYGVSKVYHGGNAIDGEARFNKQDIHTHGLDAQCRYFGLKYPKREGITTEFITGDDHEGWYVQREGINIGNRMQEIAEKEFNRNDLVHLGYMERDVELVQDGGSAIMRVIHAGGGSAYAISYTSQKYVEALQGGEKPKIVLVGHFHKFDYSYPREVHVIQGGCTVDQTPFMRKKRLQAMVGGCVLWIKQAENGVINSLKVEWIPFYDKKFYQYEW